MDKRLKEQNPTLYLPNTDGLNLKTWKYGRRFLAYKICPVCGTMFQPNQQYTESMFSKRVYCSASCVNRKQKLMGRERQMKKCLCGGNGRPTSLQVRRLVQMLKNNGWELEVAIPTGCPKKEHKYPTCYKVDIADPRRKIAIEVDGESHRTPARRAQDAKKKELLERLGWKVYHITNKEVDAMCIIFRCQDILHILQEVF